MLLSRSCLGFAKAVKPHFSVLSRLSSKQSQTPDSDDDDEGDEDNLIRKEHNTTYKFMDRAQVEVHGGRGGNGCVSFEVLTPGKKRPTGGNGGRGGDVYVVADRGLNGLSFNTFHFNAGNGKNGGSDGLTGKRGADVYIKVPLGTVVTEQLSNTLQDFIDGGDEEWEEEIDFPSIDLDSHNSTILVVEGGVPGIGNGQMAGSSSSRKKSVPATKMPGQSGGHKTILLELKLIADVGLVGFPNAGKSTLLKALSNARPKIAPYPFTTLHPNIGVVEYSDLAKVSIADIPGLVDGASENKGLGHDFLRHIERTKILLYVVDGAGGDRGGSGGNEPASDLRSLWKELKLYDERLLLKPAMLFVNKSDLESGEESSKKLQAVAKKLKLPIYCGSADKGHGVGAIAVQIRSMLEKLQEQDRLKAIEEAAKEKEIPVEQPKTRIRSKRVPRSKKGEEDESMKNVKVAEIIETTDPIDEMSDAK